jgi:hypothetical protein
MKQLFNTRTKKLCQEVIETKSTAYRRYINNSKQKFAVIKLLVAANILIDPTIIFLKENSEKNWFLTGVLVIFTVLYVRYHYKRQTLFIDNTNWQEMAKIVPTSKKKLLFAQVNNQLEKNKKAVRITIKCIVYFFSIIIISSWEDNIKMFFINSFNAVNIIGWGLLIYMFCLSVVLILLPLSSIISAVYFIGKWIITKLKKIIDYCIDNAYL